jgi:hypothetical protein
MLRQPGGPVAVIAGSRVGMPYGMGVLSTELMSQCFGQAPESVGEALLAAKRKMINQPPSDAEGRALLDAMASLVSPQPDLLATERAEHVRMFGLFGDPMLRLRWPKPIQITAPPGCQPGETLALTVSSPVDGPCLVELTVAPGRIAFRPPAKPSLPTDDDFERVQANYQRANDLRLSSVQGTMAGGRLDLRLEIPPDSSGRCCVRAFVEGADDFAMGAVPLDIRLATESEGP